MRGIIIVSSTSSVVFHTAPFSREFVDNTVAVVESDIHVLATAALSTSAVPVGASTFHATLRKASIHRHGGSEMVHAARWLDADHRKVCDNIICLFPTEHPWLATLSKGGGEDSTPSSSPHSHDEPSMIYWRKCTDRVLIFVLESEESLSLARCAMSNFIVLLCETFHNGKGDELPSLKEMIARPDWIQACCSAIAPQHVLALVPLNAARTVPPKLLASKKK